MQLEVGKIYEGKVTGITKFGAFVEIEKNVTGMVHISEVANSYVNEIKDHLQENQIVKVKVLTINDDGKISLSIKKAVEAPPRKPFVKRDNFVKKDNFVKRDNFKKPNVSERGPSDNYNNFSRAKSGNSGGDAFEDMLNKFKQNSEEKIGDLKKIMDNKRRGGSRRPK